MAVRDGMPALVELVARLVNDPEFAYHEDWQIQDALDQYREEARYWGLVEVPTRAEGGAITYLTFKAPCGHWEADGTLYDHDYTALTPATSDWMTGRWTFSSAPTRPVYLLGWTYDVYAAAADLLEVRGSQLAEDLESFSVFNGSFAFAAKRKGPLELAARYRAMQRVTVFDVYRSDVSTLQWPT